MSIKVYVPYSKSFKGQLEKDNRSVWARQQQEERDKAFLWIKEMTEKIRTDQKAARTYLDIQARFGGCSVNNAMLIASQRPDAKELAPLDEWQKKGEGIKKGELGIILLEFGKEYVKKDGTKGRYYNIKKVFDVSQTTAEGYMEQEACMNAEEYINALAYASPCNVKIDEGMELPKEINACFEVNSGEIYVRRGGEPGEIFRDLVRAEAACFLEKKKELKCNQGPISEAAAYMVCARSGIDTMGYSLGKFMEGSETLDDDGLKKVLSEARSIANRISEGMERFFQRGKEAEMDER